jgi:hypothetical protein
LAGIDVTIAKLATSIADTERQFTEERERAQRKVASEKLNSDLAAARSKVAPWISLTRELAAAFEVLETVSNP